MRIAQLANFHGPQSGGLRTMMDALAREYEHAGHTVLQVVPGEVDERIHQEARTIERLRSVRIPHSGNYRLVTNIRAVEQVLDNFTPDVIEVHDRLTMVMATSGERRNGAKVVLFAHERIDGVLGRLIGRTLATIISDSLNRWALKRTDAVIATTRFAAAEFRRLGHDTAIVPLGVDTDFFSPIRRTIDGGAEVSRSIVIGLCSRLSPEKNVELAPQLVQELLSRGVDVQLRIAGDGPLRQRLEQVCRDLPVCLHGFIGDREGVANFLANIDVLVAPGPIETFGLAALEALASGTPVVGHAASGVVEVIGAAGLSAGGDVGDWADAVLTLTRLSSEGRQTARQRAREFNWEATARRLLDSYADSAEIVL